MMDSTECRENGCARCGVWADRGSSFGEFLGDLDDDLHELVLGLEAELDGDFDLLALRGLDKIFGWLANAMVELNLRVAWFDRSKDTLDDLLERVERGPRFKVPGSHALPALAGPMNGRGIYPAVAVKTRDACVQADRRLTRQDAAVGGTPVVRVDVSVQTSPVSRDPPAISAMRSARAEGNSVCVPGEDIPARPAVDGAPASRGPRTSPTPSERLRRRRRQRAAHSADSAPSNPSAKVKGTGRGDMAPAGVPVGEGRELGNKAEGTGSGPSPPPCKRAILRHGRGVVRPASAATLRGDCRRRLRAWRKWEEGTGGGCVAEWPVQPSAAPQAGAQEKKRRAAAAIEGGCGPGV